MKMFMRGIHLLLLSLLVSGCALTDYVKSNNKRAQLNPSDTINAVDEDDECFIEEERFVVHSYDDAKTEDTYTSADILEKVYFNFDSSKILPEEEAKIGQVAKMLANEEGIKLLVVGQCDKFGRDNYNFVLGRQRAESVRRVLINSGLDASKVEIVSLGSTKANKNYNSKAESAGDRECDIVLKEYKVVE